MKVLQNEKEFIRRAIFQMNCHVNVINFLLDNGADVNKLNDAGMSALAACFVVLYPLDSFLDNAAIGCYRQSSESDAAAAAEDGPATKSVKPVKNSKKSISQHQSKVELLKIRELREEYGGNATTTGRDGNVSSTVADAGARKDSRATTVKLLGSIDVQRRERVAEPVDDGASDTPTEVQFSSRLSEFDSSRPVNGLAVSVSSWQIEQCANLLSTNEMIVGRERSAKHSVWEEGTVRRLAVEKSKLVFDCDLLKI